MTRLAVDDGRELQPPTVAERHATDAALWRHHERTGHTHHDCPAMRWADALWREWARALDLALAREARRLAAGAA
jgi:hypothetical protein